MILAGHLVRELLATLFVVTVVLLSVSVGARLLDYVGEVAQGGFAASALWPLLALRVPLFAQLVLPLSVFIAIVLTLGRASSDLELGAMHAAGGAPLRAAAAVFAVVVPMAALVGAVSLSYAPAAAARLAALVEDQRRTHDLSLVAPRRFIVFADGRRVSYVDAVQARGQVLRGVFIAERAPRPVAAPAAAASGASPMTLIWAATGRQRRDSRTGASYLELWDGHRYRGVPGDGAFQVTAFARLGQRLPGPRTLLNVAPLRARPTWTLLAGDAQAVAEWHWRWSLPVFTLVAGLLAVVCGPVPPRAGRFARMAAALTLFLVYLGVLFAGRDLLDRGVTFGPGGLLWLHLPFALVGAVALYRQQWRART